MALPSIGTTAMRWFCRVARTIVVAPASGSTDGVARPARDQIAADLLELQGCVVGHGLLGVDHGVQRVVVDLDQLGGIDGGDLASRPRPWRPPRRRIGPCRPPAAAGRRPALRTMNPWNGATPRSAAV